MSTRDMNGEQLEVCAQGTKRVDDKAASKEEHVRERPNPDDGRARLESGVM
jgi:hypothetical protein